MPEENNAIKPQKKKKNYLLLFLKRNKIKSLLFLFIALVANTYAWFIYNKVVSADLETRVKSWQITIDGAVNENISFQIDNLYPGMAEYTDQVTLTNAGELDANVTFTVHKIKIMGDTYEVGVNNMLQEDIDALLDSYPFEITFESTDELVSSGGGETVLRLHAKWDFGTGDEVEDDLDTLWGERSYTYHQAHPDEPSLEIEVKIDVKQVNH